MNFVYKTILNNFLNTFKVIHCVFEFKHRWRHLASEARSTLQFSVQMILFKFLYEQVSFIANYYLQARLIRRFFAPFDSM